MKQVLFLTALLFSASLFAQTDVNFKDTTFRFTAGKHSNSVIQYDNSFDVFNAEIQKGKLLISYYNDESDGSLTGWLFDIKTIDKSAFKENGHVRRGVGLILKGKARKYTLKGTASEFTDTEVVLPFSTETEKNAFADNLLKVK